VGAEKKNTVTSWYWKKERERGGERGRERERERERISLSKSHIHSMKPFMNKVSWARSRTGDGRVSLAMGR
jgi:cell division protein FtsI/penicillin-binding protein 2